MKNHPYDFDRLRAQRDRLCARNDAAAGVRKLADWAEELGEVADAKALRIMGARIADTAARLEKKQNPAREALRRAVTQGKPIDWDSIAPPRRRTAD